MSDLPIAPWWTDVDGGRWNANALRLLPGGTGQTYTWFGLPGRACSLWVSGREVATIRKAQPKLWLARIEGFEWIITPDMPVARFQALPSTSPLTHTPVKGFETEAKARKAIEAVVLAKPKGG